MRQPANHQHGLVFLKSGSEARIADRDQAQKLEQAEQGARESEERTEERDGRGAKHTFANDGFRLVVSLMAGP